MSENERYYETLLRGNRPFRNFLTEVSAGRIPGYSMLNKFGRNDVVPLNAWAPVTQLGTRDWQLTSAEKIRVKAGDVNDSPSGSGVRSVLVFGLNEKLEQVQEFLSTGGASPGPQSENTFLRVWRVISWTCGTYSASNAGAIIIEGVSSAKELIKVAVGEGQSQHGAYSVPADKTAFLIGVAFSVASLKTARMRVLTRNNIDNTTEEIRPVLVKAFLDGLTNFNSYVPRAPMAGGLTGGSDIWIEAYGVGALTQVSCSFSLLIVDQVIERLSR